MTNFNISRHGTESKTCFDELGNEFRKEKRSEDSRIASAMLCLEIDSVINSDYLE